MTLSLLLAFAFGLGWLPLFLIRAESLTTALPLYSVRERIAVFAAHIAMTIHMTATCVVVSLMPVLPRGRTAVGVVVFLVGIVFWVWARVLIGPVRVRPLPTDAPAELRQDGPFRIVRNPLYFGLLISATGPAIVVGRALPFLTLTLAIAVFAVRAHQEEGRLHAQLGDTYAQYCRHVRRLLPFVW